MQVCGSIGPIVEEIEEKYYLEMQKKYGRKWFGLVKLERFTVS